MSNLYRLERTQDIAGPRRDVFAFFADASNLETPMPMGRRTHRFEDLGGPTTMHALVKYAFPSGLLGTLAHALIGQLTLARIFNFRLDTNRKRFGAAVVRGAAWRCSMEVQHD